MEEDTGASSGTLKSSKKPKGCGGFSAFHCVTLHLGHNLHGLIKAERETNNLSVQLNNILISEMCSSSLSVAEIYLTEQLQEQRTDS